MTSTNSFAEDPLIRAARAAALTPRIAAIWFAVVFTLTTLPASRPMSTTGLAVMIGWPAPSRTVARVGASRVYCSTSPTPSAGWMIDGFQASSQAPPTSFTFTLDGYVHTWSPGNCQVTVSADCDT
jgi:hypothetical protein